MSWHFLWIFVIAFCAVGLWLMKRSLLGPQIRRIVAFIEGSPRLRAYLIPAIIAFPPALAGSVESFPKVKDFFSKHPLVEVACFFWPVLSLPGALIYEYFKPAEMLSTRHLSHLLAVIGHIVGNKSKRFAEALRDMKSGENAGTVFKRITKPDDQIKEIIDGVWLYFNYHDPKRSIRVVLAKMGSDHIQEVVYWAPANRPVRSNISKLQHPNSGFSTAKRTGNIVVISNSKKERAKGERSRCVLTHERFANDETSMLCYPVEDPHHHNIPYVISVCSDSPNVFQDDLEAEYGSILDFFAQRLMLEYYLKCIRERVK